MRRVFWATLVVGVLLIGCGEEEKCRSDYDCGEGEVCEPEGCAPACETNEDCLAPTRCQLRKVEDGKACRLTNDA